MRACMPCAGTFVKFLSEEWDLSVFLDFLAAQSLMMQVSGALVALGGPCAHALIAAAGAGGAP